MSKDYTETKDGQIIKGGGTRVCPNCGEEKPISEFGYRRMKPGDGEIRNQSWCKECRSK